MRNKKQLRDPSKHRITAKLGKLIHCICSVEPSDVNEMVTKASLESHTAKDFSYRISSSGIKEIEGNPDTGKIEEAETSLRESGSLNYEEARALLGRYEYQKGNIEAALHVFEGISIASVTLKLKNAFSKLNLHSKAAKDCASSTLSIPAAALLFESFFLKAKSLQTLGRYKEAAESCSVILEIVESSLPRGFPRHFSEFKLQETLNKAVELLPELWKLANSPRESMLSYRRILLHQWNIDAKTVAKIEKDFATFLLYGEPEFVPPKLKSQMDSTFVPKNNIEEALLLLTILLKKITLKQIDWDPSILDHLSYVLSISGSFQALANQVESLLNGIMDEKEAYHILALCYHGDGSDSESFNLLKQISRTQPENLQAMLYMTKICAGSSKFSEEGIKYARKAIENSQVGCYEFISAAHLTLGMSYSLSSRTALTNTEWDFKQAEAITYLEIAAEKTKMKDAVILYHLSLEYADQRKLDAALDHTRRLVKLECGSNIESMILLARILSAHKCYSDAENLINEVLDQTKISDHGALLRTKAKLQVAQGLHNEAFDTYSRLIAVIQVQSRNSGFAMKHIPGSSINYNSLEIQTWHDLALIYVKFSKWSDAETCILKLDRISTSSALKWHATGSLYEARNQLKEAIKAYYSALAIDHEHVISLVSLAIAMRNEGFRSPVILRSLLMEALRLDRMNATVWYNLGLLYQDVDGFPCDFKAAECFQASAFLHETEPIEPFR